VNPAVDTTQSDKSASDLLLDLVVSNINLARAFAAIARSAYGLGKHSEAEFAHSRMIKFYGEALRSALRMTDRDRESFSSDLENLRADISWLSMHRTGELRPLHDLCGKFPDHHG
jgi:hypothetical protein